MAKHRRSLLSRIFAPVIEQRAFQAQLDEQVRTVLNEAGMYVGGIMLTGIVRSDDGSLWSLAREVLGDKRVRVLLANRHDAQHLVQRSIQRAHRLTLSSAYEACAYELA